MDDAELTEALNYLKDSTVLSNVGDWTAGLDLLATIKHGLDTGEASIKQVLAAAEKFEVSEGTTIPPSQIEDAIVAAETAVTRAQLAKGEADHLVTALQNLEIGTQNILDKLKVVLEKSSA